MTATALVVEDDDRDMAAIEDTLCSMQHEFERTTNQSDALRFLGKRAFDYAILDLRIPARPGPIGRVRMSSSAGICSVTCAGNGRNKNCPSS